MKRKIIEPQTELLEKADCENYSAARHPSVGRSLEKPYLFLTFLILKKKKKIKMENIVLKRKFEIRYNFLNKILSL